MAADAVGEAEFAARMAELEPFEAAPELAVAVSGGRDSMALALLAGDWARVRGGRVFAFTVDHGLRPESAVEARRVAVWLAGRGIAHRILRWRGEKPGSGLQQAAREARYRLLIEACRSCGLLHLLLGHQRRDQIVTHLMRLAHGSGPEGLAGMPALRSEGGVRLLRPLVAVDRARLAATLRRAGQAWIDDPSNLDPAFERTRIEAGLDDGAVAIDATRATRRAGLARASAERRLAELAARAVRLSPLGFATLAPVALMRSKLAAALLRRVIRAVGGGAYAPSPERAEALVAALRAGVDVRRTLGGCRLQPWRGRLLVARENRAPGRRVPIAPGGRLYWDRFDCALGPAAGGRFEIGMLGAEGWRRVRSPGADFGPDLPAAVGPSLPALWDELGPLVVPHLGYRRAGAPAPAFRAEFRPSATVTAFPFAVASARPATM